MDGIKAECIFNEQVHVKEEEDNIKEEPEWEDNTGLCGISIAAAQAGLYANHEVKDELVLGPEDVQPADLAFTLYACQASAVGVQPVLRDCVARIERSGRHVANNAGVGNRVHSNANIHTEKQTYICDIHSHQEPEQDDMTCVANNAARAPNARQHPTLRDSREVDLEVGRDERRDTDIRTHGNIDVSTEEGTYICETCKMRFPLKSQLVAHVVSHTKRQQSGRGAGGVLARVGGREMRGRGSAGKRGYCCQTCHNTFRTPSSLKIHERTHTGERPYCCGTCNKKFKRLSHLKSHERTHTGERPYCCGTCNKNFTELRNLKCHERIHTGKSPFSCGTCQKKFTTSSYLKRHEQIHTGIGLYSCRTCNKKFTHLSNLKKHERTHTGERPYCCGTCNKKFTQLGNLKSHQRIHTREKPFSCTICTKSFEWFSSFRDHQSTHTGEKPYSCAICTKTFTWLSNLKRHESTHTRKPFSCGICQLKFSVSGNLKRHKRIHTGEKPYTCEVCKKQFLHFVSLKKHKDRIHVDREPFCCDICQKRFAQKPTLVGHIRSHRTAKP